MANEGVISQVGAGGGALELQLAPFPSAYPIPPPSPQITLGTPSVCNKNAIPSPVVTSLPKFAVNVNLKV